jgi:hypothetical protein
LFYLYKYDKNMGMRIRNRRKETVGRQAMRCIYRKSVSTTGYFLSPLIAAWLILTILVMAKTGVALEPAPGSGTEVMAGVQPSAVGSADKNIQAANLPSTQESPEAVPAEINFIYEATKRLTAGFAQDIDPDLTLGYLDVKGNCVPLFKEDLYPRAGCFNVNNNTHLEYSFKDGGCWMIPDRYYSSYWQEQNASPAGAVAVPREERDSSSLQMSLASMSASASAISNYQPSPHANENTFVSDPNYVSPAYDHKPFTYHGDPTFVQPPRTEEEN